MSKKYHVGTYGAICGHDGPIHNPGESNSDAAARMLTELNAELSRLRHCKVALKEIMVETNFISLQAVRSYVSEILEDWSN